MGTHNAAFELANDITIGTATDDSLETIVDGLPKLLTTDNTAAFTPTADYHPATKLYVDGSSGRSVADYGAVGDGETDDTDAIQEAVDAVSHVYVPATDSYYKTMDAIRCPSNCKVEIAPGAEIRNQATGWAWLTHTFVLGRHTRTDIASMKSQETAHSLGALTAGDITATVGLRWNATSGAFDNTATYTPAVGDLVMVVSTDDLGGDLTAPTPTGNYFRKVMAVSGADITFDKEITQSETYMLADMTWPNGFLVPVTGNNISRHYGIENFHIYGGGKITSDSGSPVVPTACLNCTVSNIETDGWSSIYGNTMRQCTFTNMWGVANRALFEIALGHEDVYIDGMNYTWKDGGHELSGLSAIQTSESGEGLTVRNLVFTGKFDSTSLTNFSTKNVTLENLYMTSSCTSRLLTIGSISAQDRSERIRFKNLYLQSDQELTSWLVSNVAAVPDMYIENVTVDATNALADSVLMDASTVGSINGLRVLQSTGPVRIEGYNISVNNIQATGVVRKGGWIAGATSGWNTTHLVLGDYHLWVDATGDLRIKNAEPASDTDGTIVGTQS
jgi:hypothetical protein